MSSSEKILIAVLGFMVLSAIMFSRESMANPGNSAGAGRTVETGESANINREKSLSQDKSSGNKATSSSSAETAREKSKETKAGKSKKTEKTNKHDWSSKLNATPLFISEFIRKFESKNYGDPQGAEDFTDAYKFFGRCRPITGIDAMFPVLAQAKHPDYSYEGQWVVSWKASVFSKSVGSSASQTMPRSPTVKELEDGVIPYFIMCRRAANTLVGTVAKEFEKAVNNGSVQFKSEEDLREKIRNGYSVIANDNALFRDMLMSTLSSESKSTRCAPFLKFGFEKGHDMDCGNFKVQGDTIIIDGVPTLSADYIDGRKFEVLATNRSVRFCSK